MIVSEPGNSFPATGTNGLELESEIHELRHGQIPWDQDPEFRHFVQDKKVIIVGPARTLVGKGRGVFIDSFDLVVRLNDVFELDFDDPVISGDFGLRTDILYINQVLLKKKILLAKQSERIGFTTFCRGGGVKYVVCTNNSLSYDWRGNQSENCETGDRHVPKDFRRFISAHVPATGFRIVQAASELLIRWLLGNWGRTGFVALVDVLGFPVRQLDVTGMTFYHAGGHILSQGPELHPLGNRDGTSSIAPSGKGHDSFREMEVLRKLLKVFDPMIRVDEDLCRILQSGGSDRTTP